MCYGICSNEDRNGECKRVPTRCPHEDIEDVESLKMRLNRSLKEAKKICPEYSEKIDFMIKRL